jgi:nucleotide-binding universal stress UspA family protein
MAREAGMTFVDRYWEWRRRRALRAQERTRELETVVDALMERRGFSRRPGCQEEQAPPVGEAAAVLAHPDLAPSAKTGETPRAPGRAVPDPCPTRRADREALETSGGRECHAPGRPTILAAIDGTRSSAEVGWHAVRLAESLRAKLFVLSFTNAAPASRMGAHRRLALAELERDSRDMSNKARELAEKSGVECEVRWVLDSHPSRAVVVAVEEVGAYCVVIGSPGASVLDRLLDRAIGGAYEKVLRRAGCPVLSVR